MILIGKGYLRVNIEPEIVNQTKNIKDIIRKIRSKEVYCQRKTNEIKIYTLFSFYKEIRYYYTTYLDINSRFYHEL